MADSTTTRVRRRRRSRPGNVAGALGQRAQRAGSELAAELGAALPAAEAIHRACAACAGEREAGHAGPDGERARETASRQAGKEEEEMQAARAPLARQEQEEEEAQPARETASRQAGEEEEEMQAARAPLARQEEEEEEMQAARAPLARQEQEEEEAQPARETASRQAGEEEEEMQAARAPLARQEEEEEEMQAARAPLARQEQEEEEAQPARETASRQAGEEEEKEEPVQTYKPRPALPAEQREPATAQRRADTGGARAGDAGPASAPVATQLRQARGGGRALDDGTRRFMERRFARDLGRVRVHTDVRADVLNRRLHARAFTNGSDLYFRSGSYDTARSEGLKLLAHELTHVVQQRADSVPRLHRQPAPAPAAGACPPKRLSVRVTPILSTGTLPDAFGETFDTRARVPFVSVSHRERRNAARCGSADGWDLCVRKGVVLATVPVTIDAGEIARRGANGERWFQDCATAAATAAFVTRATARATMTTPRLLSLRGVRRHELFHVGAMQRLLLARLQARNDNVSICPYDRRAIDAWRLGVRTTWRADSESFLRSGTQEPNEESNAVRAECR